MPKEKMPTWIIVQDKDATRPMTWCVCVRDWTPVLGRVVPAYAIDQEKCQLEPSQFHDTEHYCVRILSDEAGRFASFVNQFEMLPCFEGYDPLWDQFNQFMNDLVQ